MEKTLSGKILIAGDSTAAAYTMSSYPMMGWAQALPYFVRKEYTVLNFAVGGYSTKRCIEKGKWAELMAALVQGDFVLIQFGHNDQKLDEADNGVTLDVFRQNLIRMAHDVQFQKANPVFLTGVLRCVYDEQGRLVDTQGEYPQALRDIAAELELPLIDMQKILLDYEAKNGRVALETFYCSPSPANNWVPEGALDTSHFGIAGAHAIAKIIMEEAKRQKMPLADCFA